jgi:hypothetical protein
MKPKFLPKEGESYWAIDDGGDPFKTVWENEFIDRKLYYEGQTFKTEQEALDWYATYKSAFEV